MRSPLALGLVAVLALTARAQQLLQTHTGSTSWEFGHALLQTADQNGDGYADVIVGAPGADIGRGSIRCLSGKFLATATGPVELWSLTPSLGTNARFGSAIIEVASATGNSATDYVVGAPGLSNDHGSVYLVDGSTHQIVASGTTSVSGGYRLGETLAAMGDLDGDGVVDFAVGGPGDVTPSSSLVWVVSGGLFAAHASFGACQLAGLGGPPGWGSSLAGGFDLDHDGRFDLAVGSPKQTVSSISEVGAVWVWRGGVNFSFFTGSQAFEHFGASVDAAQDFDGDGTVDLVVGAPDWSATGSSQNGRVVVLSGQHVFAVTPPYELFVLQFASASAGVPNLHFGTSVRASADLNGDGVGDILVGAPGFFTAIPPSANRGTAVIFSGASGMRIAGVVGSTNDRLGDALLGGYSDLNGDGFRDFAVAGSLSDNPSSDCGVLKFFSLFPTSWNAYCTSKINSLGCTPSMSASGVASASSSSPFLVNCSDVINQKSGLLMYSHLPNAAAFQGGTLCVKAPLRRTATQNSGGSASGSDCTGAFAFDFNAQIASGLDATLVPGADVHCQYWSRDSASPSTTSLSNAVRFLINP